MSLVLKVFVIIDRYRVITIHPEGGTTKFYSNTCNGCGEIHLKPQMLNIRKRQGITKVSRIHPLGTMNVLTKLLTTDAEIFHWTSKTFDQLSAINKTPEDQYHQSQYGSSSGTMNIYATFLSNGSNR